MSEDEIFFEIPKKVNTANFLLVLRRIPEQIIKRLAVWAQMISGNHWVYFKKYN